MSDILVVDDEIGIRELLSEILSDEGYGVLLAKDAVAAREMIVRKPDLVLLDIWMPDTDGVSLLKEWSSSGNFKIPVIMMSGHATLDNAVEATKFGAVDFLEKPIAMKRLLSSVKTALEANSSELKIGEKSLPPAQAGLANNALKNNPEQQDVESATPAFIRNETVEITVGEFSFKEEDFDLPLRESRDKFERMYFQRLLNREKYSMTRVAHFSGLERTHLYRKLKNLGLEIGKENRGKAKNENFSEE